MVYKKETLKELKYQVRELISEQGRSFNELRKKTGKGSFLTSIAIKELRKKGKIYAQKENGRYVYHPIKTKKDKTRFYLEKIKLCFLDTIRIIRYRTKWVEKRFECFYEHFDDNTLPRRYFNAFLFRRSLERHGWKIDKKHSSEWNNFIAYWQTKSGDVNVRIEVVNHIKPECGICSIIVWGGEFKRRWGEPIRVEEKYLWYLTSIWNDLEIIGERSKKYRELAMNLASDPNIGRLIEEELKKDFGSHEQKKKEIRTYMLHETENFFYDEE